MDRAGHKVVLTDDTDLDRDAFQQLPDRCFGVLLRAAATTRLFLGYGLMIDHFQSMMPRAPPEGGKVITICMWPLRADEIRYDPDAPELPVHFVIDEGRAQSMDTETIAYSSWEELRHELHVGVASPQVLHEVSRGYIGHLDQQAKRSEARTRYLLDSVAESIAQMTEVEIERKLEWLEDTIKQIVHIIHAFQARRGLPLLEA
jgi:hypothetical protein